MCADYLQENGNGRLETLQGEGEEVKVIMLDNLNKTDERGEKLSDLDVRAEELLQKVSK